MSSIHIVTQEEREKYLQSKQADTFTALICESIYEMQWDILESGNYEIENTVFIGKFYESSHDELKCII